MRVLAVSATAIAAAWCAACTTSVPGRAVGPASDSRPGDRFVLDEDALEGPNGVRKVLIETYRINNLDSVDCPANQEVRAGHIFECTVRLSDGTEKIVEISLRDNDGTYEVGLPK